MLSLVRDLMITSTIFKYTSIHQKQQDKMLRDFGALLVLDTIHTANAIFI